MARMSFRSYWTLCLSASYDRSTTLFHNTGNSGISLRLHVDLCAIFFKMHVSAWG